jgi:hypothetical protein
MNLANATLDQLFAVATKAGMSVKIEPHSYIQGDRVVVHEWSVEIESGEDDVTVVRPNVRLAMAHALAAHSHLIGLEPASDRVGGVRETPVEWPADEVDWTRGALDGV